MTLIVPKSLQHLIGVKKIKYKNEWIKSVHLFHLVHRLIYQWTFDKTDVPLHSKTLQKIYGIKYHLILEYLLENGIIKRTSNYSTDNGMSIHYKLSTSMDDVQTFQSTDYVFNKNHRKHWEEKRKKVENDNSPIPVSIRKKILDDLYTVTIKDFDESIKILNEEIKDNPRKYIKNLMMLTSVYDGDIFWEFDDHGRFHSNLTSLMKEIRNTQLLINGEPILSLDIKTSQPLFFVQMLKKEWLINSNPEIQQFIQLVENGDLYKHLYKRFPEWFTDRDSVKPMVFRCLFDEERYSHLYKELFSSEFPEIYEFLVCYHTNYGEPLWKTLQRMESKLIFGKIYQTIITQIPDIKLFTVHDSIHYPERYHQQIKKIWEEALAELINK